MGSLFWSWIDRRATNLTFCRGAIGVSSELIIFTGLNEQPFLYRPGRHSFRDLAGMSGFTPIVACGLRRNDVAPCHSSASSQSMSVALWFDRMGRLRANTGGYHARFLT